MADIAAIQEQLRKKEGRVFANAEDLARIEALKKKIVNTKGGRNITKAALVSQDAIYKVVQFTFVHGSRQGDVNFMRMSAYNAKRLGVVESKGTVVTVEVERNGHKTNVVKKENLVQTQNVQFSVGRSAKKRKVVTKGGRALRRGGKTVGGGVSSYAKEWVSAPVPKSATTIDIIAHAMAMKTPIYEIRFNGSSVSLRPYATTKSKRLSK
jgi:hypothetical protein